MVRYDTENGREYKIRRTGMTPPSSRWSDIECPFCERQVRAYHWSLSGSGKKCPCGAMHYSRGMTYQPLKG